MSFLPLFIFVNWNSLLLFETNICWGTVFIVLIGFLFVFFYKVSKILSNLIEAIGVDRKQSYEEDLAKPRRKR